MSNLYKYGTLIEYTNLFYKQNEEYDFLQFCIALNNELEQDYATPQNIEIAFLNRVYSLTLTRASAGACSAQHKGKAC